MRGKTTSLEQVLQAFEIMLSVPIAELPSHPMSRFEAANSLRNASLTIGVRYDLAQYRHRYGVGEGIEELGVAVKQAEKLAVFWKQWNHLEGPTSFSQPQLLPNGKPIPDLPNRVDGVNFRFAAAAIISLLVRREMSPAILDVVPKTADFGEIANDFHYWNFTDAGLVEMLLTGRRPRRWNEILEFATNRFRNSQIQDNFESYAKIILSTQKEDWDTAVEAVHESERLYSKRPYHSGDKTYFEAWEVSPYNGPAGMDLRLAALMKHCFRHNRRLLASIDSIHKW